MREKIYHHHLKKIFEKFKRECFYTYSYLNTMDLENYESKEILKNFIRKRFICKESILNNKDSIDLQDKWRLTGKAIVELYHVFNIEIEDSDYLEAAILTLSE